MAGMRKVAAHQKEVLDEGPSERLRRLGNDCADSEAKAALRRHPGAPPAERAVLEQAWDDATVACTVIAKATLMFPSAAGLREKVRQPTTKALREQRAAARRAAIRQRQEDRRRVHAEALATHRWVRVGSLQRCSACFATHGPGAGYVCPGIPTHYQQLMVDAQAAGHQLMVGGLGHSGGHFDQPLQLLLACSRCGSWATAATNPRCSLRGPCLPPTVSGTEALRRMRRGDAPKAGRQPDRLYLLTRLDSVPESTD